METLVESHKERLKDGEFFLSYYHHIFPNNELAPLLAIDSGIVVISGTVGTGRTHLLQFLVNKKLEDGLNVLLVAHEHNEIQGVDTLIFHKTNSWKMDATNKNPDIMLSRIDAITPDVVVFDDMDYPEILAMANALAEKGTLVLAVTYNSFVDAKEIVSRFELLSDIEGEAFRNKQEKLITGHVRLGHSLIRTEGSVNADTKIIAKVLKP